jgi:hypothetical protein
MSTENNGPSQEEMGVQPEEGKKEAPVDGLLQFAKFEVDRVTELLNAAIGKNSKAEMKGYQNLLDKSLTRLDLLKTEVRISGYNLEILREMISGLSKKTHEDTLTAADDKFDAVKADSEAYDDLKTFLEQHAEGDFRKRKDFKKWQQEAGRKKQTATETVATQQDAVGVRRAEADKAKENEVREKILMASILEQGGAGMYASFPKQFHPGGYAGYEASYDSKRDGSNRSFYTSKGDKEFYKNEDVNEVVQLVPMVEQIREDIMSKAGIFRKPVKINERIIGEKPIQHDTLVRGGKKVRHQNNFFRIYRLQCNWGWWKTKVVASFPNHTNPNPRIFPVP